MRQYKQSIQIGNNVTDIMRMECVQGVFKNFAGQLVYQVNCHQSSITYAGQGDWICQDHDGCWNVVTKDNYNN